MNHWALCLSLVLCSGMALAQTEPAKTEEKEQPEKSILDSLSAADRKTIEEHAEYWVIDPAGKLWDRQVALKRAELKAKRGNAAEMDAYNPNGKAGLESNPMPLLWSPKESIFTEEGVERIEAGPVNYFHGAKVIAVVSETCIIVQPVSIIRNGEEIGWGVGYVAITNAGSKFTTGGTLGPIPVKETSETVEFTLNGNPQRATGYHFIREVKTFTKLSPEELAKLVKEKRVELGKAYFRKVKATAPSSGPGISRYVQIDGYEWKRRPVRVVFKDSKP